MNGFLVENGGMQCSIQDAGRRGLSDIGLTQSGAMDEMAFGYANFLVGNAFNTPAIEIAMGGASFKARSEMCISICGANMQPTCNGHKIALWQTYQLRRGDVIAFGFATQGQFAYIAVAGGFQTPFSYGSYSTSIKEGLGGVEGRKLKVGDFLETLDARCPVDRRKLERKFIPKYPDSITVRLVKGYQEAMFDASSQETFFNSVYTFRGEGDRMGYRLSGERVVPSHTGILSEPICYGAVQVPSHGEPIVLLKERQTIGGYPKIGSVIAVDCFKLAQLKVGGTVKFKEVSLKEAQRATRAFYTFFKEQEA
jgi:biotin-dependent carboxylase-like uncharacterized protein